MNTEKFDSLIKLIKFREEISEAEICKRLGYNTTYLSQVRSRGTIPEILIKRLQEKFDITDEDLFGDHLLKEESAYRTETKRLDELLYIIKLQQETMRMQQETIQTLSQGLANAKRSA